MEVVEQRFRVMASDALVVAVGADSGALARVEARLRGLEALWSRFLPGSDITRLNTTSGSWVSVAPETILLLQMMQRASSETAGAYDPTLLSALLEAGYTTSIDDPGLVSVSIDLRCPTHTVADIGINSRSSVVRLPPGLAVDPGGIGKGLAADLVLTELLNDGAGGALVNIGGDLAAGGVPPSPDGWTVAIEDPFVADSDLLTVAIDHGGVATSSSRSRRWRCGGSERHHHIDPPTRTCSTTDLAAVTVIASSGWLAEAHATGGLLAGADNALSYLDHHDLAGLAVTGDGRILATRHLARPRGRRAAVAPDGAGV